MTIPRSAFRKFVLLTIAFSTLPVAMSRAQEEGTTPGAIPDPSTYQGSSELQRQSDQQDQQFRQQQQQQPQQYSQPNRSQYAPAQNGQSPGSGGSLSIQKSNVLGNAGAWQEKLSAQGVAAHAAVNRGDFVTAVRLWMPLAQQGSADAQYNLGVMYENGHGVAKSYPQALKWYQKAANQGLGIAMGNLGLLYALGEGMRPNLVVGYKWLKLAIAHLPDPKVRANVDYNMSLVTAHMSRYQIMQGDAQASLWREPVHVAVAPQPTTVASNALAAVPPPSGPANSLLKFQVGEAGPGYLTPLANVQIWVTTDGQSFDAVTSGCRSQDVCTKNFKTFTSKAVTALRTDAAGHAQAGPLAAGRYYVFGITTSGKKLLWKRIIDVQVGANVMTLDQTNGTQVE